MVFATLILLFSQIFATESIMTSDISSKLNSLSKLEIIIEITNINIDVPKSSYLWNELENRDFIFNDITFSYRVANINYFPNETY